MIYKQSNVEGIKRSALRGTKQIWVKTSTGKEGLILATKYSKEWWKKATAKDIRRITIT